MVPQYMYAEKDNTPETISENSENKEFIEHSSLYQEFLAERDEILRHKWIESEKRGKDIGFERALLDWIRKHRQKWRSERAVK